MKVWEMLRFIRTLSILTQSQQKEFETHKRFKVPNKKNDSPINKEEDHKYVFQDKTAHFWSGPLL